MRSARLHGREDLRVDDVPTPVGEVLVRVTAATTCGTDVKMWRHGHRVLAPYPCPFGHETAGVRVDTGEAVLVSDSVACRRCRPCQGGRPQICRDPTWILGGFAELIAAPRAALHTIPHGLEPAGAAMAEPLAAAVHAVSRAGDADDAAVLGGGTMGLMLARLLILQGRSVTLADRHSERRAQAEELGARAVDRLGTHDLVMEAVGRPDAWRAATRAANPGGRVVLVGGCRPGSEAVFDAEPLHYEELELHGAFHHRPLEVDAALEILARGDVPWRALAGETIGLDDLQAALAVKRGGRAIKWIVTPEPVG